MENQYSPEEVQAALTHLSKRPTTDRMSWQENLGQVQDLRSQNPVGSPVSGGTPAQRRLEMEQAQLQFEEQMKLQRDQMALQERLARMARSGGGGGGSSQQRMPAPQDAEGMSIQALVNAALRMGDQGLPYIRQIIARDAHKFSDVNQALSTAENMFRAYAYDTYGNPQRLGGPTTQQISSSAQRNRGMPISTIRNVANTISQNPLLPSFAPTSVYEDQYYTMFPENTNPIFAPKPPTQTKQQSPLQSFIGMFTK